MNSSPYPSKLLLLGEYTVIEGSQALAIPHHQFKGSWIYNPQVDNTLLLDFLKYLHEEEIDLNLEKLKSDIHKGWHFESDIPVGYGAGSSGALCAAIYDHYHDHKDDHRLIDTKKKLAAIESYFHGESSGLDPLVSYYKKAVKINRDKSISLLDKTPRFEDYFSLIDTKIPRSTAPLVSVFQAKCRDKTFLQSLEELKEYNDAAIEAFLIEDNTELSKQIKNISAFQLCHFSEMIPLAFISAWKKGLCTDKYYLKLCGAGGGGFIIRHTPE